MMRIGIDVGGTHTDAVLMASNQVLQTVKTATTRDITSGITTALTALLSNAEQTRPAVDAVVIGTTHFTNAIVEQRELSPVAAVRIGLPASASLPPFVDWPAPMATLVRGNVFMIRGGHEVDGRRIVDLDEAALVDAAVSIRDSGLQDVAVSSVFSPLDDSDERRAAEILCDTCPALRITLSSELGRLGLLERENATLLNASIRPLALRTIGAFRDAIEHSDLNAPLFLTQNDGTVMQASYAERLPLLSIASGPTNSMRGAAYLSGINDALVADVGGTTTDIGALQHSFPRQANTVVEIGDIRTAFRMPDLFSLGLGGGSMVDINASTIGPRSVGFELTKKSRVFGGGTLTATDLGVHGGRLELGDPRRVSDLDKTRTRQLLDQIALMLEQSIDRMKTDAREVRLIAVGGGDFLVPTKLSGVSEVVHLEHGAVANAVGAAISQVSGEVDQVFSGVDRDEAIESATHRARERAIEAGASEESLQLVDLDDLPIAYLPGDARRVHARVVGDIAESAQFTMK